MLNMFQHLSFAARDAAKGFGMTDFIEDHA